LQRHCSERNFSNLEPDARGSKTSRLFRRRRTRLRREICWIIPSKVLLRRRTRRRGILLPPPVVMKALVSMCFAGATAVIIQVRRLLFIIGFLPIFHRIVSREREHG
jgi:hypothetical protein